MTECRDWAATLWQSSYKGVPFWVESDDEDGGRRLIVHEFPNRDDPYVEDLGEAPRWFNVTAYLASDVADLESAALTAVCAGRGAGILVLPSHGPLIVRCETFKRERSKDRSGYIAVSLRFVREGAVIAIPSVPMLANLVFVAVAGLAAAAAAAFSARVKVRGEPEFVVSSTVAAFQEAVALVDVARSEAVIDQAASAAARDTLSDLYGSAPNALSRTGGLNTEAVTQLFSVVQALGDAMAATSAVQTFSGLVDANPGPAFPAVGTQSTYQSRLNEAAISQMLRLAALSAYAEALTRAQFRSRPEGISAKAEAAERFELEMSRANGAENAGLFLALQDIRGRLVEYLSAVITDLAPVVTIEAPRTMPSLWWAWRLYGDPGRGGELVARNRIVHPSFMPETVEALAR